MVLSELASLLPSALWRATAVEMPSPKRQHVETSIDVEHVGLYLDALSGDDANLH